MRQLLFKLCYVITLLLAIVAIEFFPYGSFQWITVQADDLYASENTPPRIVLSTSHVGSGKPLFIQGRGFEANEPILIRFDLIPVEALQTNNEGFFEATIAVPQGNTGQRTIQVLGEESNTSVTHTVTQAF